VTLRQRKTMQWLRESRQRTNWLRVTSSEPLLPSVLEQTSAQLRTSEAQDCKSRSEPRSSTAIAIAASLMLIGCASTTRSLPPATPVRVPPAAAMVPCLVPSDLQTPDLAAVTTKLLETAEALAECRAKHRELVDWIGR
jgi:hypothetical protein